LEPIRNVPFDGLEGLSSERRTDREKGDTSDERKGTHAALWISGSLLSL